MKIFNVLYILLAIVLFVLASIFVSTFFSTLIYFISILFFNINFSLQNILKFNIIGLCVYIGFLLLTICYYGVQYIQYRKEVNE